MSSRLRIVATGLVATYPFGGVFWDYLQYPLGLHRLGHEVLYVEDTGRWCYDPVARTFVPAGRRNAALLARSIGAHAPELRDRWFLRDVTGAEFGRPWDEVVRFCAGADLFIHLSASCWMREEYFAASTVVFVDSDPMFTQASVPGYLDGTVDELSRLRVDMLRRHDVFFTFGENVGATDCLVPTGLFDWRPTRQPIVLERFRPFVVPLRERRRVLTTVASWAAAEGAVVVDGVAYAGKAVELERFLDLPRRSALPLEIALSGEIPAERLRDHGWRLRDPDEVSRDAVAYRRYLARSLGEWSIAKNAYVASRSGWFSGRSACYLALGVPVIVQSTGFERRIPTGEGILTFSTLDGAAAAIEELARDPARHEQAARAIAEECFGSDVVLARLVEEALDAPRRGVAPPPLC